jgi:hypothetical protein
VSFSNPVTNFIDDPNNKFEQAKGQIGEKLTSAVESDIGISALEKAKPVFSALEYISRPYRNVVAPAISAGLLMANTEYRRQNQNENIHDLYFGARKDSMASVSDNPGEEWRRAISPGRALVALLGQFAGGFTNKKIGTEKIDWSNPQEVNSYFSSGSAQFFSGIADFGFNFADPLLVGGKLAKLNAISRLSRNNKGAEGIIKISDDLADARAGKENSVTQIFKHVEENQDNLGVVVGGNKLISGSANPDRFGQALIDANLVGGRALMADVIELAVNPSSKLKEKFTASYPEISVQLDQFQRRSAAMERSIESLGKKTFIAPNMTRDEVLALEKANSKIIAKKSQLNEIKSQEEILKAKANLASAETVEQVFGGVVGQTWAKSPTVERIRREAQTKAYKGLFLDVDPVSHGNLVRQVSDSVGTSAPLTRAVLWLSPNSVLKELPSGFAWTGGTAATRSSGEVIARIRQAGKLGKLSAPEQMALDAQYRGLTSKNERFQFLENLEARTLESVVLKYAGRSIDELPPEQRELVIYFAKRIVNDTRRAKYSSMKSVIEKNYTVTDATGNAAGVKYLNSVVEEMAKEHAMEMRKSTVVTAADREAVELTLKEVALSETQIPYMHMGVDSKMFDKILSENTGAIRSAVEGIIDYGWTKKDLTDILNTARDNGLVEGSGLTTSLMTTGKVVKPIYHSSVDALSAYYAYVWKPITLLSLKYTTRNIFEGALRTVASMADMNTNYGYSWSAMLKGEFSGSLSAPVNVISNVGTRKSARLNARALSERNLELNSQQQVIERSIGGSKSARKYAEEMRTKGLNIADQQQWHATDGVHLPLISLSNLFDSAKSFSNSADPISQKLTQFIENTIRPVVFDASGIKTKTTADFWDNLTSINFESALKGLDKAESVEILTGLQKYTDNIATARKKLINQPQSNSTTVQALVSEIDYMLERLSIHSDLLKVAIANKNQLMVEVAKIGSKTSAKTSLRESKRGRLVLFGDVSIDASLGGQSGDMLRFSTSSSSSGGVQSLMMENKLTAHSYFDAGQVRKQIEPTDANYIPAHVEYVNNVIAKDPVYRVILEGKRDGLTPDEILLNVKTFLKTNNPEAIGWKKEVRDVDYHHEARIGKYDLNQHLHLMMAQVELYLPSYSLTNNQTFGKEIFQKVLNGKYTPEDSAKIPYSERHTVVGSVKKTDLSAPNIYRNIVGSVFKFIGSLPETHLIRHPFYSMVHDAEAKRLTNMVIANAKKDKPNITNKEIEVIIGKESGAIKTASTNRAYKELMQRLYSVERYTDTASFLRFVTPFYMAAQNSTRFWLGTSLREPEIAIQLAKAYNIPYRAGYVYDENGEIVGSGNPWSTDSAKEQIVLGAPSFIRNYTGQPNIKFNPVAFDVISQGQLGMIPTAGGPAGQFLATSALQYTAKNSNVDPWMRKNLGISLDTFSQKYVMPYYEKTAGASTFETLRKTFDPSNSWMVSAFAVYGVKSGNFLTQSSEDRWNTRYNSARDYVTTQMIIDGQSLDENLIQKLSTELATKALVFETVTAGGPGIAPIKVSNQSMDELRITIANYQSQFGYSDGSVKAAAAINEVYDTGSGVAVIRNLQAKNATNKLGLIGSNATLRNLEPNLALVSDVDLYFPDNPFVGELFNRADGEGYYSQISDDVLYSIEINGEPLKTRSTNPAKMERQRQYNSAWAIYYDSVAYIEEHAKKNNVTPGTDAYKNYYGVWKDNLEVKIGEQFPLWAQRENKITLGKSDQTIKIAQLFLQDEKFMKTVGKDSQAIQGLAIYLRERNVIIEQLNLNRQLTGTIGLDTKANRYYLEWRDQMGQAIVKDYPEFKDMYNRYLADDELNIVESPSLGKD